VLGLGTGGVKCLGRLYMGLSVPHSCARSRSASGVYGLLLLLLPDSPWWFVFPLLAIFVLLLFLSIIVR